MRFDMTAAPVLLTVAVTAAAPVECAVAHVRHTRADKGSCHLPRAYAALQQIMSLGDVKGMGTWTEQQMAAVRRHANIRLEPALCRKRMLHSG